MNGQYNWWLEVAAELLENRQAENATINVEQTRQFISQLAVSQYCCGLESSSVENRGWGWSVLGVCDGSTTRASAEWRPRPTWWRMGPPLTLNGCKMEGPWKRFRGSAKWHHCATAKVLPGAACCFQWVRGCCAKQGWPLHWWRRLSWQKLCCLLFISSSQPNRPGATHLFCDCLLNPGFWPTRKSLMVTALCYSRVVSVSTSCDSSHPLALHTRFLGRGHPWTHGECGPLWNDRTRGGWVRSCWSSRHSRCGGHG